MPLLEAPNASSNRQAVVFGHTHLRSRCLESGPIVLIMRARSATLLRLGMIILAIHSEVVVLVDLQLLHDEEVVEVSLHEQWDDLIKQLPRASLSSAVRELSKSRLPHRRRIPRLDPLQPIQRQLVCVHRLGVVTLQVQFCFHRNPSGGRRTTFYHPSCG
jgi:hypothetical protein